MTTKKTIFDFYNVDVKSQNEGTWVGLICAPEVKVKVKSAKSREFKRAMHISNMKNARILDKQKKTFEETEILEKTLASTAIKYLLVDWDGMIGEDGKVIKFSTQKAIDLLLDPRLSELLDEIVECATTPETFKTDEDEAQEIIEGN